MSGEEEVTRGGEDDLRLRVLARQRVRRHRMGGALLLLDAARVPNAQHAVRAAADEL